jgi:1-acyl-sn-glycerol-3-phosphate acyltransferase
VSSDQPSTGMRSGIRSRGETPYRTAPTVAIRTFAFANRVMPQGTRVLGEGFSEWGFWRLLAARILSSMGAAHVLWYYIVLHLARFVFFLLGGIRSRGKGNVPRCGATIIAPLHVSHLDPPAVACGTNRRLRFMAKEELFHHKQFGWLIRSLGAFPVKRGEGDTESIRLAMKLLDSGEAVLIFPEGTRGDGQTMNPMNKGVPMLAKRTGAQVVPVGVVGTHKAWPRGQSKPKRHRITLLYGEPFTYEEVATGATEKENRELFLQELERRLIALCAEGGLHLKTARQARTGESSAPRSVSDALGTSGEVTQPASVDTPAHP